MIFLILSLISLLFLAPQESFSLAKGALEQWFNLMIPSLLPFMILSGILLRTGYDQTITNFIKPILRPFFPISDKAIYALLIGFLCGFPMGAKTISELYNNHQISKKEANKLLGFCNLIGPIYVINCILPRLHIIKPAFVIFLLFGIPALYGILMCNFTPYNKINHIISHNLASDLQSVKTSETLFNKRKQPISLLITSTKQPHPTTPNTYSNLIQAIDSSILNSLSTITKLGGYMICFSLLNLYCIKLPQGLTRYLKCLTELNSGISTFSPQTYFDEAFLICCIPFAGICCLFQTIGVLQDTDLSIFPYLKGKIIQTTITILLLLVLFIGSYK